MVELDRREIGQTDHFPRASVTKRRRRDQDAKKLATPNARFGLRKGVYCVKFPRQKFAERFSADALRNSPKELRLLCGLVDFRGARCPQISQPADYLTSHATARLPAQMSVSPCLPFFQYALEY